MNLQTGQVIKIPYRPDTIKRKKEILFRKYLKNLKQKSEVRNSQSSESRG